MIDVFLDDEMEMPCPCDCGQWFDLTDGYGSKIEGKNRVVCTDCHNREMKYIRAIEKIEEEIDELEYLNRKPKRVEKLRRQVADLKVQLESGEPFEN